jgi:hypothetical protein
MENFHEFVDEIEELLQQEEDAPKELTAEEIRQRRFAHLERAMNKFDAEIKKASIEKPYLRTTKAINLQLEIYKELYASAKNGLIPEPQASEVIAKYEEMQQKSILYINVFNEIRSLIEQKIYEDADDVDELLEKMNNIEVDFTNLEENVANLYQEFGLTQ